MGIRVTRLRDLLFPPVPAAIRDAYDLLTAAQLERHGRTMMLALLVTTPPGYLAAAPGAPTIISHGAPIVMGAVCLIALIAMVRRPRVTGNLRRSRRVLRETLWLVPPIALLCQVWAIVSWFGSPPERGIYYVFLVATSALAATYSMAGLRLVALINLAIALVPITTLLAWAGGTMNLAAAISLGVAGLFQVRMILDQHNQFVDQLLLQRRSNDLAQTDPLTGLLNRRALLDNALQWGSREWLRLILVDIDHFKAINDEFGHTQGDEVLREVANVLAVRAEIRGSVARMGGEEFALLGTVDELTEGIALAILTDMRNAVMPHGRQVTVSIGVAEGPISSEADWRDLYQRADQALYEAKRNGRNRLIHASEVRVPDLHQGAAA